MGNTELNLKNLSYEEIQVKIQTNEELIEILEKNDHINEIKDHSKFVIKLLEKTIKKNDHNKIWLGLKIINKISLQYPNYFIEKYYNNEFNIFFNFYFNKTNIEYTINSEENFNILWNFINKLNFYPDEDLIWLLFKKYQSLILDFNDNIKYFKIIINLLYIIFHLNKKNNDLQKFLNIILKEKINKMFEKDVIKELLFKDLLFIKKNIYFILNNKNNYVSYMSINLDNISLIIKENNYFKNIKYTLDLYINEIFDSELNERNILNFTFDEKKIVIDFEMDEYILLYYCFKIKIIKNNDENYYDRYILDKFFIKLSKIEDFEIKENDLFLLNFIYYFYKRYYQYMSECEIIIIIKLLKYYFIKNDNINILYLILLLKILSYTTFLENFSKIFWTRKNLNKKFLEIFYYYYNIYVYIRDNDIINLKGNLVFSIIYEYLKIFSNLFLVEHENIEEIFFTNKDFRENIENCFEAEFENKKNEKNEKMKFNCHLILINYPKTFVNIKIDIEKFFNFISQKCLEINNIHFINKSLHFLLNLLEKDRKFQINFFENYVFFYFNLLNLNLNFNKSLVFKIFLILIDYTEFIYFWFYSFQNNNLISLTPHFNKYNIIQNNLKFDKIIIDPNTLKYNHFSIISISFWFFYNRNDFTNRFYTMIQNELGIGGLFVVNNNKEFGYFNENNGNFSCFGFNISDVKNDWNHIFIELNEINLKKSSKLIIYLNGRWVFDSPINIHTRIKYIGNSKDNKENFFPFNDFRIYCMKFTEDEIIELSSFKKYIKNLQFRNINFIYSPCQNLKDLLYDFNSIKSELNSLNNYNFSIKKNLMQLLLKLTNDNKERKKILKDNKLLFFIYELLTKENPEDIIYLGNLILKNLK